jgi:hypothetical protein
MLITKRTLVVCGTSALLAVTGVAGSTMVNSADAALTTHHMRFITHSDRNIQFGKRTFGSTEIERHNGHRVGFDVISGKFNPATHSVTIYISVARRGGLLHARVHSVSPTAYVGRVTGGSGRFMGARGTVTARDLKGNNNATRVVVTYTLP